MSGHTAARWTRETWDQYVEQVRDTMPTPEISHRTPDMLRVPSVVYACPICLHDQPGITIETPEDGKGFTATWHECGHAVTVDA
jgi:hypothetical protein